MDRRMATPLYYRERKQRDFTALIAVTWVVGAMMGATVALFVVG